MGAEAATFETAYLAEVRRAPKELESYLAEWKAKKRTDSEVLLKLYSWAMAACTEGYQCHRYGLKLDVEVLESGVQHEDDLLQEQVRKTGATGQVDAARAVLWNQALARAGILHQRVSGARSRWCIELWRYYDFALAKTASPTDGHALMVADIRKHIDSTFASQRRPIKEALTTLNFGKDTV